MCAKATDTRVLCCPPWLPAQCYDKHMLSVLKACAYQVRLLRRGR